MSVGPSSARAMICASSSASLFVIFTGDGAEGALGIFVGPEYEARLSRGSLITSAVFEVPLCGFSGRNSVVLGRAETVPVGDGHLNTKSGLLLRDTFSSNIQLALESV